MKKILFTVFLFTFVSPYAAFAAEPTIAVPPTVTAEAAGADGATVSFSATALDADASTTLASSCAPASGSLFALGTTTVTCTATSTLNAASTTQAAFTIRVVDTTPPVITPPADQTFATSTLPAFPALAFATAVDAVDPSPSVSSDAPASFPLGTTTVTWMATDASGNVSTTTSLVVIAPQTVDVPDTCTVTDTGGATHAFPQSDSPSSYLGVCLLEAAKEAGYIDFTVTDDPSFGLYVQSVNNTQPGATEYWALWDNGALASCGIRCTPLLQGETLSLILTDWMTNTEGVTVVLRAHTLLQPSPPPAQAAGGGSGDGGVIHQSVHIPTALAFLSSAQQQDGSFGSTLVSDWAALAFAAADPGAAKGKLHDYLRTAVPAFSSVTDYERHALALLALGINPYTGTPADVITPIVRAFDGTQIGDASLDTDDIFAVFPLLHAGYHASDELIQKVLAFILSRQGADGSWDGSVDVTAAAIQALTDAGTFPGAPGALARAEAYLHAQQAADGGFGNSFSASWALQAIAALHEPVSSFASAGHTPQDYLAGLQQADGGIEPTSTSLQTRVWATEYAVPAVLGKTWGSLLVSFPRPEGGSELGSGNDAPAALPAPLTVAATSTPLSNLATSTLAQATSTVSAEISTFTPPLPPVEPRVAVRTPARPLPAKQGAGQAAPAHETALAEAPGAPAQPAAEQTAAVANAPVRAFFSTLWRSITAFFSRVL